jgi:hypothetical protein
MAVTQTGKDFVSERPIRKNRAIWAIVDGRYSPFCFRFSAVLMGNAS